MDTYSNPILLYKQRTGCTWEDLGEIAGVSTGHIFRLGMMSKEDLAHTSLENILKIERGLKISLLKHILNN